MNTPEELHAAIGYTIPSIDVPPADYPPELELERQRCINRGFEKAYNLLLTHYGELCEKYSAMKHELREGIDRERADVANRGVAKMTDAELDFIIRDIEVYPFSNRDMLIAVSRELKNARERLRRIGEILINEEWWNQHFDYDQSLLSLDQTDKLRRLIHGDPK